MPETLEEKLLYNDDENYNCQLLSCNVEATSFCSCSFKENAHSYTLEDLEEKRWQLINLQRAILSLRQLQVKKRKSESKFLKLAIKSKCKFIYPDIKMNVETSKIVAHENELVKSELCYLSNGNGKEISIDRYQDDDNILHLLRNSSETIYKIFEGRLGHLQGDNVCAYVIISSEALYIVNEDLKMKFNEVLYENVELIIIGKDDRWFSVIGKESDELNDNERDGCHFQIDTGDSTVTKDIIKYLEISIRRRLIALSVARSRSEEKLKNLNQIFKRCDSDLIIKKYLVSNSFRFSYGRWLESLLPTVMSCSNQEVYFIENWLMDELKIKKRPQVLACWLVFWENGSEFHCEEEQIGPRPCLDGYLMVNSPQHNFWTPAYFLLKGGILYRFCDSCDKLPQCVYRIRDYCGCQRLTSNARPHAFELLKSDGNSLIFAAPNEETSSQWLQLFLRIISNKDDDYMEKMKLKPCQVIQTTESLILCYQRNTLTNFRPKENLPDLPDNNNKANLNLLKENSSFLSPLEDLKAQMNFKRPSLKGALIPNSLKGKSLTPLSSSVPISIKERSVNYFPECPPTPPLPEIEPKGKESGSEPKVNKANANKPSLQLLSFCNLDQISDIFVTSWATNGCLMEFECSEASEIAGDWALYFPSENQLSAFLNSVVEFREKLTKEFISLTKVSSGRVHDLLLEGAETSKSYWKPSNRRLI